MTDSPAARRAGVALRPAGGVVHGLPLRVVPIAEIEIDPEGQLVERQAPPQGTRGPGLLRHGVGCWRLAVVRLAALRCLDFSSGAGRILLCRFYLHRHTRHLVVSHRFGAIRVDRRGACTRRLWLRLWPEV